MAAGIDTGTPERSAEPAPTGFDVFVLLLTIFSLINLVLEGVLLNQEVVNVILIVDGAICIVFFVDFLLRLYRAPSKRAYLIGDLGWLELLGSLPLPVLRIARIPRMVRVGRELRTRGLSRIGRQANSDRAGSSLLAAVFMTIVVLQYGSMTMLRVEDGAANANIRSASDALWWSYVTITTVGYGDRYPVTNHGRVIGVAMLSIGVGLFGVLTGFLANLFLAPRRARRREPEESQQRMSLELEELRGLIAELRSQTAGATHHEAENQSRHDPLASTPATERRLDHGRN